MIEEAEFEGKMSWEERRRRIYRVFPSTENLDWVKAFDRDVDLLGHLLRDILKSEVAEARDVGRPGPRPGPSREQTEPTYNQWMGIDISSRPYSTYPFPDSFGALSHWQGCAYVHENGRSLTSVARKVDLPRTQVYRLLRGLMKPTTKEMERIAEAFSKSPSFFIEYRVAAIASSLVEALNLQPEKSIRAYETMQRYVKK